MGGTGDVAGPAVLQGQAGHGVLGERVAIPQMKCTHPAGSGGKAESVNAEQGGSFRPSHNPTHNCLALYCCWRGPAVEVQQYKYGNDNSMCLASCGQMWSGSRAPLGWTGLVWYSAFVDCNEFIKGSGWLYPKPTCLCMACKDRRKRGDYIKLCV